MSKNGQRRKASGHAENLSLNFHHPKMNMRLVFSLMDYLKTLMKRSILNTQRNRGHQRLLVCNFDILIVFGGYIIIQLELQFIQSFVVFEIKKKQEK